jgi:phospholipid/cholesterol/gamma-HCH transport system substrate-binding protein
MQLWAFVSLTLVGTSYVGARYAGLDALVWSTGFTVTAPFTQSGGIFTGAEVAYRGVTVGKVTDLRLTPAGVDVVMSIDNGQDRIPADTLAVVSDRSAVGEQYLDLEPRTDEGPFLHDGSRIPSVQTRVPVSTTELLSSIDSLVTSIPQDRLRTSVSELGAAFEGTGPDLGRIIDGSDAFTADANRNFAVTTRLIQDSNTVLRTQLDKGSALRGFARNLSLFSGTLASRDLSLRRLLDTGAATATELRSFLDRNQIDLGELINRLVTTGEVIVKHLPGQRQVLTLYPYAAASGYTIMARGPGGYQVRGGLVLNSLPATCHEGYDPHEWRPPTDVTNRPMDEDAHCAEPPTESNPRGSQNAPRAAPDRLDPPVVTYDAGSRSLAWNADARAVAPADGTGLGSGLEGLLLGPILAPTY